MEMNKKKNNDRLDEMQYKKRNEIVCVSYSLLFFAVFFNGILKLFIGEWAEPLAEAFVVLFIPMAYFVFFATLNNVYFGNNQNKKTIILLDCLATVTLLLDITVFKFNGAVFGFRNGKIINNFWKIPMLIIFLLLLVAYFVQSNMEKSDNDNESDNNYSKQNELDLVLLKTTKNAYELSLLEGMLKDNNIPYIINYPEGGGYLRVHSGGSIYPSHVLVEKSFYEDAKKIVDEVFGEDL